MRLAIGDVVRHRGDMALGTVAGVASHDRGNLVLVNVSGEGIRLSHPDALDVVAQRPAPTSTARGVVALLALVLAVAATVIACRSAAEQGADWLLTVLAGLGGYTAVASAYQWALRLAGPRRFRV